eukprot:gene16772-22951_t
MFLLAVIEDKIKTIPEQFDQSPLEVLIEQIEEKYSNRVIIDVGLCISFYDFVEIGDPYIYPSEGSAHNLVKFRLVIFRPFIGEIIIGKILSCGAEGLKVSIDFFDDIIIPSSLLPDPSTYHPKDNAWIWKYSDEDYSMIPGEEVRLKVKTIQFTGVTTSAKGIQTIVTSESSNLNNKASQSLIPIKMDDSSLFPSPSIRRRSASIGLSPEEEIPAPMQVIGAINDSGLGLITWW